MSFQSALKRQQKDEVAQQIRALRDDLARERQKTEAALTEVGKVVTEIKRDTEELKGRPVVPVSAR